MWISICLCACIYFIYYYVIKPLNYWKDKNVLYEKAVPLFGNNLPNILRKKSNTDIFSDSYKKYSSERYFGMFNFSKPMLIIRDPDLIKTMFVKEFETFPEHVPFISEEVDPLWSKNLFSMKGGQDWQDLRSTLSPSFTSSKMKIMFGLMKDCSRQFSKYFLSKGEVVEVELIDTFSRFANDIIGSTAFGVTVDSLTNPKNDFYVLGQEFSNFFGIKALLVMFNLFAPKLAKIIKLPIFNKKVYNFFTTIVRDSINMRREKGIVRPDMLHLLMQAQTGTLNYEENKAIPDAGFAVVEESDLGKKRKKQKAEVTDEIITAQVLIFFFAGFNTVSTMLSYVTYELAINPDVQNKLRAEVDEVLKNSDGEFTYNNVTTMKYLDMVISESLRKWSPFVLCDRHSVRSYTIQPKNLGESVLTLEKGSMVICPISAIHLDAKYYPNPEKFDPERFNEVNKHKILPYTYIPFGVGPRNCIGSRFALLEGKLIIAEIVSNFEIVKTEKTLVPMVLSKSNFNPLPDNGIWVGFKPRSK